MAGDTNDLKIGPILRLNGNLKNIVKKHTRINHKNPSKSKTIANIITDLHNWHQEPLCLPPIEPDSDKDKASDHLTVICEPINVINNIPLRHTQKVKLRPITDSGKHLFKLGIKERKW